ncbi:MAG: hypothetical protein U1E69_06970 [Tabrizicola sp.]|uniref:hypothetical protein n=1 Tax=Tabrizicola sp. TaxID=2005166 RepID=UPI002AB9AA50|nr:hypothetical protein [Tabrizicola sp.]MDZ4086531.1 hypothetical protein [Tabrizicola sp.]
MNALTWLLRAKRWAQNPPSEGRVKLVFGVVALCLVLVGIEYFIGWPDWMTVDSLRQKP